MCVHKYVRTHGCMCVCTPVRVCAYKHSRGGGDGGGGEGGGGGGGWLRNCGPGGSAPWNTMAHHHCRMEHLAPRFWTSVPKQQERPEQILVLRLTAKALEASAKATSKLAAGTPRSQHHSTFVSSPASLPSTPDEVQGPWMDESGTSRQRRLRESLVPTQH